MQPLHKLFDEWRNGQEDWYKTKVYIETTHSQGSVESDARGWVTKEELVSKMGRDAAQKMILYKEQHRPDECRDHPDAPGIQDRMIF